MAGEQHEADAKPSGADVEAAQKEIVVIAQRLADEGTINLGGKGASEFV